MFFYHSTAGFRDTAPSKLSEIRNYKFSTHNDDKSLNNVCHEKITDVCENKFSDYNICCEDLFSIGHKLTFSEAKLFCNQRNMEMAAPFSASSNSMVLELHSMVTGNVWLDLIRQNGQFNLTTAYANWELNNSPEDKPEAEHVVIRSDGKWRVVSDSTERRNVVCVTNGKTIEDLTACHDNTNGCTKTSRYNWAAWSSCSKSDELGYQSAAKSVCSCPTWNYCDDISHTAKTRRKLCNEQVNEPTSITIEIGHSTRKDMITQKPVKVYKVEKCVGQDCSKEQLIMLQDSCESGWTMHKIENKYKCIKLVESGNSIASEAQQKCRSEMAQVPVPMNEKQFEDYGAVFKSMNTSLARMWIGINDVETEGTFINVNTGQTWTKPASVGSSIEGNDNHDYVFMSINRGGIMGTVGLEDVVSSWSIAHLLCEKDLGKLVYLKN